MSAMPATPRAARSRTLSPRHMPLGYALGLGLAYRWAAIASFPVVFDEVQVMAYAFARGFDPRLSGDPLFETPLAVSNGITPLWLWIQALPQWLFGQTSVVGLRSVPVLLGLVGICLAYHATMRLAGARAAWLAASLYAVLDPFVFTNAHGQFSESLIAPLTLALLLDLLPAETDRPLRWRVAAWPALAMLTYLGKGLLVWSAYLVCLGLLWLLGWAGLATPRRLGPGRALLLGALPAVPTLIWLWAANAAVFGRTGILETDVGPVSSTWQLVERLTFGYGSAVKATMVGTWRDALYPYLGFDVWPTTTVLAPLLLATLGAAVARLARALRAGRPRETERWLVPLCLALPPAAIIVVRGVLDARFHLLYLGVLIPYAAECLDEWLRWLERGAWKPFVACAALGAAWFTYATRAEPAWSALVVCWLLLLAAARARLDSQWAVRLGSGGLVALLVTSSLLRGPLRWGQRWAWEPNSAPGPPPKEAAAFPPPDVDLARTVAARHGPRKAVPYLRQAIESHADDRAVLLEAGSALLSDRSQVGRVVELSAAYLRTHADDEEVRRLLARAMARASR